MLNHGNVLLKTAWHIFVLLSLIEVDVQLKYILGI